MDTIDAPTGAPAHDDTTANHVNEVLGGLEP
jgi:hypothetical protein